MKVTTLQAALGSALLLYSSQPASASLHGHKLAHSQYGRRHTHSHHAHHLEERDEEKAVEKRGTCVLPDDPDLVSVPGAQNGGFAMAPDRSCAGDSWCPYACAPGKVMAQWKPNTKYTYPDSMYGGVYCDNGTPKKSFSNKPYCVEGTGTISAVNTCGKVVSFCQTVLPGDEGMYIRTDVTGTSVLAVPGPSYWDGTAAHYYVNPPGVPGIDGCVWGDQSQPRGNWSPFVVGANTDSSGQTFVKLGWNPIFIGSDLAKTKPTFGLKIKCNGGGCNGLPCAIDPSKSSGFGVESSNAATGAGAADFCVVTVPKGGSADIVVFNTDGSTGETSSSSSPSPSPSSTSTSSSNSLSSSISSSSSSSMSRSSSTTAFPGGIFHNNGTYTSIMATGASTTVSKPTASVTANAPASTTSSNDATNPDQGGAAVVGLIVAVVAGLWLY